MIEILEIQQDDYWDVFYVSEKDYEFMKENVSDMNISKEDNHIMLLANKPEIEWLCENTVKSVSEVNFMKKHGYTSFINLCPGRIFDCAYDYLRFEALS